MIKPRWYKTINVILALAPLGMLGIALLPHPAQASPDPGWKSGWDDQIGDDISPYHIYWFDPVPWEYKMNQDAPCGPGYGYWLWVSKTEIDVTGFPVEEDRFTIHLKPGWNLIGYPFHQPPSIELSKLRVSRGGKEVSFRDAYYSKVWMWAGFYHYSAEKGDYEVVVPPGELERWKGYWAYAWKECNLIIPKK